MRKYLLLVICAVWVAFVPPARTQWVCHVAEGMDNGQGGQWYGTYWYSALSCKGNNAVSAALVDAFDTIDGSGYYLAFLISTDGGASWNITGQGLPAPTWDHAPIIGSIDQIDSLNIIAFGDSDFVRTTDGGVSWQLLHSPSKNFIEGISFSDALHGILVADDTVQGTYVTSDGGLDWIPAPFTRDSGWQCHDYGNGMYRIMTSNYGVIYTTRDNWNTIDSTTPIIADPNRAQEDVFRRVSFGAGDTIFAYGYRLSQNGTFPCIARTTNGGKQWGQVYDDSGSIWIEGYVHALSDIDRDTIVAGLDGSLPNRVLCSTDRGVTWKTDTLLADGPGFSLGTNAGVALNSSGQLLAAYVDGLSPALLLGRKVTSEIRTPDNNSTTMQIFPNPATSSINITSITTHTIRVLDLLGREVLSGTVAAGGTLTLNVSSLPSGLYFVNDGIAQLKFVKE
ncbi:MAG TPA: T9SS type A sorting domain-containing protein [Candidatus Kapabacteria bacterium]|nr:T9SS type A sorting domain-containing protein [Candidatus Kapabacteria bacterium]